MEFLRSLAAGPPSADDPALSPDPAKNPGVRDGVEAVRWARAHAAELGVDPNRIGIMGFSAGAIVTNGVVRHHDEASRPNFAAQIYFGAPADTVWPKDTPPMFLAVSADDHLAIDSTISAFQTLRAQKHNVELHVYNSGGHGWGIRKRGLTADLCNEQFTTWLASLGFMTP